MAASGGLGNFPTVVALFKFRRRTRTCLNQTGASSAPEFEQGDHGTDISVQCLGRSAQYHVQRAIRAGLNGPQE